MGEGRLQGSYIHSSMVLLKSLQGGIGKITRSDACTKCFVCVLFFLILQFALQALLVLTRRSLSTPIQPYSSKVYFKFQTSIANHAH